MNNADAKVLETSYPNLKKKINLVINNKPENGRFPSIKLGLNSLSKNENCFIHNIDNPGIGKNLLNSMTGILKPKSFVVPVFKGKGGHPILLSKEICSFLQKQSAEDLNLKQLLSGFEKTELPTTNENVLLNINTREDYIKFKKEYHEH